MAQKLTASMPEDMDLEFTYTLRFAALDPTSGADVAGVVISEATMLVTPANPQAEQIDLAPFLQPVPSPGS